MDDLPQNLNLNLYLNIKNKNIIHFKTIQNNDLYAVYDPQTTTLGKLLDSLFDNYDSKAYKRENLLMYSEQLKRVLNQDSDDNTKKLSEYNLNKITDIKMMTVYDALFEGIVFEKNYNHLDYKPNKEYKEPITPMQIFVKTSVGTTITLDVDSSYDIAYIKYLICERGYGTPRLYQLIFAGKMLEDDRTLDDYNIQSYSTLHCVKKLWGGMYHETSGRAGNYQELKSCIFCVE